MTQKTTDIITPRADGRFDVQIGFYRWALTANEVRALVTAAVSALAPGGIACVTCGAAGAMLPQCPRCIIESAEDELRGVLGGAQ